MKRRGLYALLAICIALILAVPAAYALEEGSSRSYLDSGFSTAPELTEETRIDGTFYYSERRDTFYYVSDEPIQEVKVQGGDESGNPIVDCEIDEATDMLAVFTIRTDILKKTTDHIFVTVTLRSGGTRQEPIALEYNEECLWWRFARRSGGVYQPYGEYRNDLDCVPDWSGRMVFYYGPSGEEQLLDVREITVDGDRIASAEQVDELSDGTVWEISVTGFGEAELYLTTSDDTEYTFPVIGRLPLDGFCTAPSLTEYTYIRSGEFQYSDSENIVYYVGEDWGSAITSVDVEIDGEATTAIESEVQGKNVVELQIIGPLPSVCSMELTIYYGSARTYDYLTLVNGNEQIFYQNARRYSGVWETDGENWSSPLEGLLGRYDRIVFYYGTPDDAAGLSNISSVTIGNPEIAQVENIGTTNDGFPVYEINYYGVGSTETIIETAGGQTYTVPVWVELPASGFYTAPIMTADNYIVDDEFVYTLANENFYYIDQSSTGYTGMDATADMGDTEISLVNEGYITWKNIDSSGDQDTAIIEITVQKPLPDHEMRVSFSFTEEDGYIWSDSLWLINGGETLVWVDCDWNGSQWETYTGWTTRELDLTLPSRGETGTFYYGVLDHEMPLQGVVSVTAGESGIVTIERDEDDTENGLPVWQITPVGVGKTELTVTTAGGTSYAMPVTVSLPRRGFCTAPEMTAESYIADAEFIYTLTDNNDTLYFIHQSGIDYTDMDATAHIVDTEISLVDAGYIILEDISPVAGDATIVRITIQKALPDREMQMHLSFTWEGDRTAGASIQMRNGEAALLWVDYEWDGTQWAPNYSFWTASTLERMLSSGSPMGVFYYGALDHETPLQGVVSVTARESGIVEITRYEETTTDGLPMWHIAPVGVGETTLTVTTAGGTSYAMPVRTYLPGSGFCTAPEMTEDTFINGEFTYSNASKQFYYVTTYNDLSFTNVELYTTHFEDGVEVKDSVDFAQAEIGGNGKYICVSITDDQKLGEWTTLSLGITETDSYDGEEYEYEEQITIFYARQKIVLSDAMLKAKEENPAAKFYAATYDGQGKITDLISFWTSDNTISFSPIAEGCYKIFCLGDDWKPLAPSMTIFPE